jgi:hypothetical protein
MEIFGVAKWLGCQAFFPLVRIGSPPPPHLQGIVAPPLPFGSKEGDTLACGGGGGEDLIPTKGKSL